MLRVLSTLLLHPEPAVDIKKKTQSNPHFTRAVLLIGKSHFQNQSLLEVTKCAQILLYMIAIPQVGTSVTQQEHHSDIFRQTQFHPDLPARLNFLFQNQFYSKVLESQVAQHQITEVNGFA